MLAIWLTNVDVCRDAGLYSSIKTVVCSTADELKGERH